MRCAVLALCLACPAPALAEVIATPGAAGFDYGIFCSLEPDSFKEAEDTIEGTINQFSESPDFIWKGTTVPAMVGMSFGVHVQTLPQYEGAVRFTVSHPPMGNAGTTQQGWIGTLNAVEMQYVGFSFDHDYETVTGPWTMRADTLDGDPIYEITFDVVDPRLLPEITAACGRSDLLS